MNYKQHTTCRVCGYDKLTPYLDLGMMPLSNNLCQTASEEVERFPLVVCLCEHCGLSQLSVVIPPEKLFAHYVYRSGISEGYKRHCRDMAKDIFEKNGYPKFHIDIAGNDGTLLYEFDNEILESSNEWVEFRRLNIDPAENLVKINEEKGIRQYTTFWGMKAVEHLKATQWPLADLITATNVIAHVDDIREFMEAIREMLAPDGRAVIECPYIVPFIKKKQFNQIYFEHASYMSITPFVKLCNDLGLIVLNCEEFPIHGGSIRLTVGKRGEPKKRVNDYMHNEHVHGYTGLCLYEEWAREVKGVIQRFRQLIYKLYTEGSVVAGFAASAKGNTLLNAAGIEYPYLSYIIDETPEKIGKISPGTGIPIWNLKDGLQFGPDYIVILAENFWDEIVNKCRINGFKGKFINPLTCEIV